MAQESNVDVTREAIMENKIAKGLPSRVDVLVRFVWPKDLNQRVTRLWTLMMIPAYYFDGYISMFLCVAISYLNIILGKLDRRQRNDS